MEHSQICLEQHWYFGENAGWEIREMHMAVAAN
jgi:hypothetical protein